MPRRTDLPPTRRALCAGCGRPMPAARRWRTRGCTPRWCSAACRRRRLGPLDRRLEEALLAGLSGRASGASLCPSEAARAVAPQDWRAHLEATRRAVRRLAAAGRVEVLQGGRAVDAATARGPIRVRLCDAGR